MKWLRLYHEARNDAKLEHLSDDEFRVWFRLICFAGEQNNRGSIESLHKELLAVEVAKGDLDLLTRTIEKLKKLRIVENSNNSIDFINWDKRQFVSDNVTERVQKHRETLQKRYSNDDVTPPDTEAEAEADPEAETKEAEAEQNDATSAEKEILSIIRAIPNYPFEYTKDLDTIRNLSLDFPNVNILAEIKKWREYKKDNPLKDKSNGRLQIRNWMEKAEEYRPKHSKRPVKHK